MGENKKYDAVTPRPKYREEGVWWHRVGNAIQNDKGQISIYLDSVPVPDPEKENKIVIMLFESKTREERESESKSSGGGSGGKSKAKKAPSRALHKDDYDDEIPF